MKYTSSARKAPRNTEPTPGSVASAGPNGIAIAPPTYGIDVVDRGPVDVLPKYSEKYQSLASVAQSVQHGSLQRTAAASGGQENQTEPTPAPPIVHEMLRSSGQSLDTETRTSMETRFNHDFSQVRVHTDAKAIKSAEAVNAQAYTVGSHIAFNAGQYASKTEVGRRLLAHELTHVIQQGNAAVAPDEPLKIGLPSDPLEVEAEGAASSIDRSGVDRLTVSLAPNSRLQRQLASSLPVRGGGVIERRRRKAIERDWSEASDPQAITSPPAPVSVELTDAPAASVAMDRVQLWLVQHRQQILVAEARHAIDRRAIAGAIAWEALENVRDWYWLGYARFQGPGKVHYKEFHTEEGEPVAKEVEERGYLPRQSMEQRRDIVATPAGAIEYIATIMEAYADEAALASYNIRYNPAILATFYNGVKVAPNLKAAREYFQTKRYPEELKPNEMGQWIINHLAKIEAAVGKPSGAVSGQPGIGDLKLREEVLEERRRRVVLPEQEAVRTRDISSKQVETKKEDPGQKRADAAKRMVEKLSKTGAKYRQQPGERNWQDYTLADCSKFVQWTLEEAEQGSLFGRERATSALMQQVIQEMSKDGGGLRSENPLIGDIMVWGGHVGIVTDVSVEGGLSYLEFAAMGGTGASLIGKFTNKKGQRKFWLKVSDVPGNAKLGTGGFLGYWTPP